MRITSIERHKLDTNKNIFRVIEVCVTMFTVDQVVLVGVRVS